MRDIDPRPWLLLVLSIGDQLRVSPGVIALDEVVLAALRSLDEPPVEAVTRWRDEAAATVGALPDPPAVPNAHQWTLLVAARAALAECDQGARLAPVLRALDAVDRELELELRGARRWALTEHALERYRERFAPGADEAEVTATLRRLAARARPLGAEREGGWGYLAPEDPRVKLVVDVAHEAVVTVAPHVEPALVARALRRWRAA